MEVYKRILSYLSENDNGEFIDITHLDSDFKFLSNKARELATPGYIKIASSGVYILGDRNGIPTTYGNKENLKNIKAKILLSGHEYLKKLPNEIIVKPQVTKSKKIESLNSLIYEVRTSVAFERSKVDNFVIRAQQIIAYVDGSDSQYLSEINIFKAENLILEDVIADWQEKLLMILEQLKAKIYFEDIDDYSINLEKIYVSDVRINQLKEIENVGFDLMKLIQLCKELNDASRLENYYTVGMLVRTIINHVPPIFLQSNFDSVVNQYKSNGNTKSFKETIEHLEKSSRKIADSYVHSIVRSQEILPTEVQVDFKQGLDVLLGEIVRILK